MDTATASRLKAAEDNAVAHQRANDRAFRRSGRIFRKPTVAQPSALDQIKANGPMAKMGRAFNESRAGVQRSANVTNAKKNGTFDTIREKYNRENLGNASMSDAGDIAGPNSPAPAVAAKSAETPPAAKQSTPPTIARPESQRGQVVKPSKADLFPPRARGVIRDETGDRTADIQRNLAAKSKPKQSSPSASPAKTAGEMIKDVDSAIAKNKSAIDALKKTFPSRKPEVSRAEKTLGKPVVDNMDKGSNFVPYTKSAAPSKAKPSPAAEIAKAGGAAKPSSTAPAGGWGKLAKDNFNKSMAGEIVQMSKDKASEVATTVGEGLKQANTIAGKGYAAAAKAVAPVVKPIADQAKKNWNASQAGQYFKRSPDTKLAKR